MKRSPDTSSLVLGLLMIGVAGFSLLFAMTRDRDPSWLKVAVPIFLVATGAVGVFSATKGKQP